MSTVAVDTVRETLAQHFPEYVSGCCLCGLPVDTYQAWIDHIIELLGAARRTAAVLGDEHKGSLWINRDGEIWAWVQGDWRLLRTSGLWSGIGLYIGESQMRAAGPFTEVDFALLGAAQ